MTAQTQNVAIRNVLPTNLKDQNLGDIYDTNAKLISKSIVKEIHKQSSKDTPKKDISGIYWCY